MTESMIDIILLLGGFQVVVTGLLAFAGKIWINSLNEAQKGDISTELERLKADLGATNLKLQSALDRDLHVHKLQFEKEQSVYAAIWSTLVEVQKAVVQLRPVLDYVQPDESEEERKRKRLSAVFEAFNPFLDQINKERPFYAEDVYKELHELRSLMHREVSEYRILDPHDDGYWDRQQANAKSITDKIDAICEAIRDRMSAIAAT